jgi:hypothetical protein
MPAAREPTRIPTSVSRTLCWVRGETVPRARKLCLWKARTSKLFGKTSRTKMSRSPCALRVPCNGSRSRAPARHQFVTGCDGTLLMTAYPSTTFSRSVFGIEPRPPQSVQLPDSRPSGSWNTANRSARVKYPGDIVYTWRPGRCS